MKKKDMGIGEIKYAEINFYYPVQFITELDVGVIAEKIGSSKFIVNKQYLDKKENNINSKMYESVKAFQNKDTSFYARIIDSMGEDIIDEKLNPEATKDLGNDFDKDVSLIINESDKGITIAAQFNVVKEIDRRRTRVNDEFEHSQKIYGDAFISSHDRFMFIPFKVILNNKKEVYLNAFLYLFGNKMAIIKFELPIIDMPITFMCENNFDNYVYEISEVESGIKYKNIDMIINDLIKKISAELQSKILTFTGFKYISLVDFEGIPNNIKSMNNKLITDIFKIIAAPVPDQKEVDCLNSAKKYLENCTWNASGVQFSFKSTGGCLSLIDSSIRKQVFENMQRVSPDHITENDETTKIINYTIARDIGIAIEYSLLLIILNRINNQASIYNKITQDKDIRLEKKEYMANKLFIIQLREGCYGSVSDQLDFVERSMPHYVQKELLEAKLNIIDKMIEMDEVTKNERFQDIISLGSLLFTIMLGLPAIYETLFMLRINIFSFIGDIPIISLGHISIVIWLIAILILYFRLKKNKTFSKSGILSK